MHKFFLLVFFIFLSSIGYGKSIQTIYNSIDPTSICQLLAFHELYSETDEGKEALTRAWKLLNNKENPIALSMPNIDLQFIINLINKDNEDNQIDLSDQAIDTIDKLGTNLKNRTLKGHFVWTKEEVLKLPVEEVDLSRALFIEELNDDTQKIKTYEAYLDLIALQILPKLPNNPTAYNKIHAINKFIFFDMGFKFPPHSLWPKNVDTYTFLPSVLDSRKGVCLGISILYLCLAQRLDLNLEIITPPGHIYIRYKDENDKILNIETTVRGIDIPTEAYLGIETKKSQFRNIKEVTGLALTNKAANYLTDEKYETAISLYEKALDYLPSDPMIGEFLGYCYYFTKSKKKGLELLKKTNDHIPEHTISKNIIIEDLLNKKTNDEGIKACLMHVDETRQSILKKQKRLEKVLKKYPKFRAGILQLASSYMQLGQEKKALDTLLLYDSIDNNDPLVNYYIAAVSFERMDYNKSWKHLKRSSSYLEKQNHFPSALKQLEAELEKVCPDED